MSLTLRMAIINFAGLCVLIWAYSLGYIARVMEGDVAHMAEIMAGLFVLGILSAFRLAIRAERIKGKVDLTTNGRLKAIRSNLIRSEHLVVFSGSLFILSIIGNALGIKAGFQGIDVQQLASSEGVLKLGAQVLSGASMTFGSTIIGASLSIWTTLNAMMLHTEMRLLELDAS
ncbi:hypothetical protein LB542_19640 [Mesorhizobium sp. BR1-1-9]|uniref:hypothetical protein n=1 Tax=Mesorhizobium sp. BR1-1-9 TaxID=2876646 RepID=UPI001CD15CB3|nr:hypothetical protein [Mesorhizobium sp. BR1-1-9]MBZ9873063.1 hypothetical protein [Mesorhizobium sp. BR1-1-9]